MSLIGAALFGGAFGLAGSRISSSAMSKASKEDRAWQLMMSSTAHQREVEDLRKAGLNPVLSATSGNRGAPMGSGSTAKVAEYGKRMSESVATAVALKRADADIKNIDALTRSHDADARLKGLKAEFEADKLGLYRSGKKLFGLNSASAIKKTGFSIKSNFNRVGREVKSSFRKHFPKREYVKPRKKYKDFHVLRKKMKRSRGLKNIPFVN